MKKKNIIYELGMLRRNICNWLFFLLLRLNYAILNKPYYKSLFRPILVIIFIIYSMKIFELMELLITTSVQVDH